MFTSSLFAKGNTTTAARRLVQNQSCHLLLLKNILPRRHPLVATALFSTMSAADNKIGLKQLFDDESSTYTYLLWDQDSKDCILVDPVDIQVDRDIQEVKDLGLNLLFGVNTRK